MATRNASWVACWVGSTRSRRHVWADGSELDFVKVTLSGSLGGTSWDVQKWDNFVRMSSTRISVSQFYQQLIQNIDGGHRLSWIIIIYYFGHGYGIYEVTVDVLITKFLCPQPVKDMEVTEYSQTIYHWKALCTRNSNMDVSITLRHKTKRHSLQSIIGSTMQNLTLDVSKF